MAPIYQGPIKTANLGPVQALDRGNGQEFCLTNLFEITKEKSGSAETSALEPGKALVISQRPQKVSVSYHSEAFRAKQNDIILRAQELNDLTGLFVATILKKEFSRSPYQRSLLQFLKRDASLQLPALSEGEQKIPNLAGIERYMRSLPYSDVLAALETLQKA